VYGNFLLHNIMSAEECPICRERYGGTVIPMLSKCCTSHLCFHCAESHRNEQISQLEGNRKKIKCMFCCALYHSVRDIPWILDSRSIELTGLVVDLSALNASRAAMQLQTRGTARSRNSNSLVMNESDAVQQRVEVEGGGLVQEIVGGQQPRRSRRHRNIRSEEQDGAAASMTRVDQQREGSMRSIRRRNAASVEQGELAGAGHAPKRGRPVESEQSEVTENGGISRSDSIIFQQASRFFRIRQFKEDTKKGGTDKLGCGPPLWCAKNSFCASSARILASIKISDPDEAMKFLRETDEEALKNSCVGTPLFLGESNVKTYTNSYKRFASMEVGDIVAMIVPGPPLKSEVYFGVIRSNDLKLMTPSEAEEAEFPAMHLLQGGFRFNGLMLREVRWLRKAFVRDLPGQKLGKNKQFTVPWLAESSPFWLSERSEHLNMIKSQSFIEKTTPVEEN